MKNNIGVFQIVLLVVASIITGFSTWFLVDSIPVMAISWSYIAILSTYLNVDLVKMIRETSSLPKGEFKEMDFPKYVVALALMGLLLLESYCIKGLFQREMDGLISSYTCGVLFIIGGLISGIQANKIATLNNGSNE